MSTIDPDKSYNLGTDLEKEDIQYERILEESIEGQNKENPNVSLLLHLQSLLTNNLNLLEKEDRPIYTAPYSKEIQHTIGVLNSRGIKILKPDVAKKWLTVDEIAQIKQQIKSQLETLSSQTPKEQEQAKTTITPSTSYESHQFSSSNEPAQSLDPDLELFGVNTTRPKMANLAHEFLYKAAIPKIAELNSIVEGHGNEIKNINQCREALLDIKKELSKYSEENKKCELTEVILEKIAFLETKNIKLLNHLEGKKELSKTELLELKEQISSQTSKLQFDQQTLFTAKMGPDFNKIYIMLEIAKLVVRIDNQMMNSLTQNQKVN